MSGDLLAYLSAGSNLEDRRSHLGRMLNALGQAEIDICRISSVFETEPVGVEGQPWFLNLALEVRTSLSPGELLALCHRIEHSHGRIRTGSPAPRPLDLDILLYDRRVVKEPTLIIPHPRMAERRFVLEPLCQIAPGAIHPVLGKTVIDLLAACRDPSRVIYYCDLPRVGTR